MIDPLSGCFWRMGCGGSIWRVRRMGSRRGAASTAVAWQRLSTGDWTTYAADLSRRNWTENMKLALTIHHAYLGTDEFRVVRPSPPPVHAVLTDHDGHLDVYLDQDAARTIAGLWMLAARSPRSLIHLPIRANRPPASGTPGTTSPRLDLVLLHHSLQFAPARWKQVRQRLSPGRPQTATLPEADHIDEMAIDYAARRYRENRDRFHQHLHAETLFMTGSAKVFRETAGHFLDIARQGPGFVSAHPSGLPFYTRLRVSDGIAAHAREFHIEYCDQWAD